MSYFSGFDPQRFSRRGLLLAIWAAAIAAALPMAAYAVNIEVGDDAYDVLLRLEAVGIIKSGLLTTRPISRNEAERLIREAENNGGLSPFERTLIEGLKKN